MRRRKLVFLDRPPRVGEPVRLSVADPRSAVRIWEIGWCEAVAWDRFGLVAFKGNAGVVPPEVEARRRWEEAFKAELLASRKVGVERRLR
jgi:hypothetical protein